MLVTALEANAEVPKMEAVTERLLHEERKLKNRTDRNGRSEMGMIRARIGLPRNVDQNVTIVES